MYIQILIILVDLRSFFCVETYIFQNHFLFYLKIWLDFVQCCTASPSHPPSTEGSLRFHLVVSANASKSFSGLM